MHSIPNQVSCTFSTRHLHQNNNISDDNEIIKTPHPHPLSSYSHAFRALMRGTEGLSILSRLYGSHPLLYDIRWHPSPTSSSPLLHLLFLHVFRPEGSGCRQSRGMEVGWLMRTALLLDQMASGAHGLPTRSYQHPCWSLSVALSLS